MVFTIRLIIIVLKWNSHVLYLHGGIQGNTMPQKKLPAYGEQIELSPIFVAGFIRELWLII